MESQAAGAQDGGQVLPTSLPPHQLLYLIAFSMSCGSVGRGREEVRSLWEAFQRDGFLGTLFKEFVMLEQEQGWLHMSVGK